MPPLLATTALEKLHNVPASFWINAAVAIIGLVVVVLLVRRAMRMNKIVLGIIGLVAVTLVGFQWIYQRNEPAFLTPFVDSIAPFFPSAHAYERTQQKDPTTPASSRTPAGRSAQPARK